MLILTYFHPIIGPDILLVAPHNLLETINPDFIEEIKNYFDTAEPGFFTHSAQSGNFKTANYFFTVKSGWARGREEMALITKVITEADPNLDAYKNQFVKFISKIKKEIKELYKVFYFRSPPEDDRDQIKSLVSVLRDYFYDLHNEFSLIKIRTYGIMTPLAFFKEQKALHIPSRFINDFKTTNSSNNQNNVFTVFQFREGRMRIEMIPVECDGVVKITLFFKDVLNPEVIQEVGKIFARYKLPLIYTSGICASDQGKCIYEVYLDSTYAPDRKILFKELMEIEKVDEVKILWID
ncbi:MAG: hypothetical protein GF364_12145 [Candidatus Lokiarchaeota archaeon]|nr:hypothetical protein [Candidatus Lokiarchaeota archaeon]